MADSSWGSSDYQQAVEYGQRSVRWRGIVGGLVGLLLMGGGLAYYFLVYKAEYALPVELAISSPTLLKGGAVQLTVTATNGGDLPALLPELTLELPERTTGVAETSASSSTVERPVITLGDIGARESVTAIVEVTTDLEPGSAAPVRAVLSYGTPRGDQRFGVSSEVALVVTQPVFALNIDAPTGIARNDPFATTIRYRNNADQPLAGARLVLVLPRGVTVVSSTPQQGEGVVWQLPALPPGGTGSISLRLLAGDGAPAALNMRAAVSANGRDLAEQLRAIAISDVPMTVAIDQAGRVESVVNFDETIGYTVKVKNASKVTLKDVVVKATIGGTIFDLSTIIVQNATVSASEPVITWSGVGNPGLRAIEPGGEVTLNFNMRVKRAVAGSDLEASVTALATSPTVPAGTAASGSQASATAKAKLAAQVAFAAQALWRDPLGQVANAGPQPPKVGTPTQYLIRWSIAPTSAGLKDAAVTVTLPAGVRFTGKLAGAASSALTYDGRTGLVTWRVGDVATGATARAGFQVEVTPASNQVGREIRLMGDSKLVATDAFSGISVTRTATGMGTMLSAGSAGAGQGQVVN